MRVIICIRTRTRKIDSISLCDLISPSTSRLISIVVSYSLRTANVSTRSSPLSGQRWARRNVCRLQATRFIVSHTFPIKQWKRNNIIYRNSEHLQSYEKKAICNTWPNIIFTKRLLPVLFQPKIVVLRPIHPKELVCTIFTSSFPMLRNNQIESDVCDVCCLP